MNTTFPTPPRIERLPAVLARAGCARSKLYLMIASGEFPSPLKIGRISGWDSRSVDAWLDSLAGSTTKREA
jgi:prophage regulatory protein